MFLIKPPVSDKGRKAGYDTARYHPRVYFSKYPPRKKPMKVYTRPGSTHYYYKFQYRGKEYYRSTGSKNKREAEAIAAAKRASIIRQAAGLEPVGRKESDSASDNNGKLSVPTLREFKKTFNEWVGVPKDGHKGTVKFYRQNYQKLLNYRPWADCRLDEIDEPQIEAFKLWALKNAGRKHKDAALRLERLQSIDI